MISSWLTSSPASFLCMGRSETLLLQRSYCVHRIAHVTLVLLVLGAIYNIELVRESYQKLSSSSSSSLGILQKNDQMSRQCNEFILPDCGCERVGHPAASAVTLGALLLLAVWGRRDPRPSARRVAHYATAALALLGAAALLVVAIRTALGIPEPAVALYSDGVEPKAMVAGAFVLNVPTSRAGRAKWRAMKDLLQSFPEGTVRRVRGTTNTPSSNVMAEKFSMPVCLAESNFYCLKEGRELSQLNPPFLALARWFTAVFIKLRAIPGQQIQDHHGARLGARTRIAAAEARQRRASPRWQAATIRQQQHYHHHQQQQQQQQPH